MSPQALESRLATVARAFALVLGGWIGLAWRLPDVQLWGIDAWPLPALPSRVLLAVTAVLLLAQAVYPCAGGRRRWVTLWCTLALGVLLVLSAARFYVALWTGDLHTALPVPLAIITAVMLWLISYVLWHPELRPARLHRIVPYALTGLVSLTLLQMCCDGAIDQRRIADAIIVFGAHAHADGVASSALDHRVRTACALYHAGQAGTLIFSGGPGDGDISEPECMRRLASALGVPDRDILLDHDGLDTRATVRNSTVLCRRHHFTRVLAVSQFYHLPRITLDCRRAGLDAYTVPATDDPPLAGLPWLMTREIAALWVTYLRVFLTNGV